MNTSNFINSFNTADVKYLVNKLNYGKLFKLIAFYHMTVYDLAVSVRISVNLQKMSSKDKRLEGGQVILTLVLAKIC